MSQVSFSKLISINYQKLYPKPSPQPTLAEVLQSEPVKRLLNQPNIVIETIPSATLTNNVNLTNNGYESKKKLLSGREVTIKKIRPEISIMPVESGINEETRYLPAKGEGDSEIALVVLKPEKKVCGHKEACENIICDVSVQQYVDKSGVQPMLAVGIREDEINAPVSKHCKNKQCDALSIDHNRCRRALIKLYRCDKISTCDICNVVFKTRRSRMSHRICQPKEVYRHNETNGAQILKEKMRERELQMITAAKTKKKEYLDPATEYKRTMETLMNNKELIVIPKGAAQPQPIITITSVSSGENLNSTNYQASKDLFSKFLPSIPVSFTSQGVLIGKKNGAENEEGTPAKQLKITNLYCSDVSAAIQKPGQRFIEVTQESETNFIQPVSLNDWLISQGNDVVTDKGGIAKPFLTPIRVVPITSLKSAPSLRHQTHGIPAFCFVPDNPTKPTEASKPQTIQRAPTVQSPPTAAVESETENDESGAKIGSRGQRKTIGRRKSEDKNMKMFKCPFCMKGFSTDWYFKMHVAGHKGEMLFTCKTCEKPFSNRYDMKKHMLNDHNDGECRCEVCGQISICKSALEIHIRSHTGERPFRCAECDTSYRSSTDLKTHQRRRHDFIDCLYCYLQFVKADLKTHLMSSHLLTEEEATMEITQSQERSNNGNDSSDNLEMDVSDCESMSNEILMRIKQELIKEEEARQTIKEIPESKKRKTTTQNGNRGGVKKRANSKIQNDEKKITVTTQNNTVTKKAANNSKEIAKPKIAVRRSARRSNSNHQCTVCKDHFDNSTSLETHLSNKSKDIVECGDCKSQFHTQTELKKHKTTCGKSSCN